MLGAVVKARRFPPTRGPAYRTLRQPIYSRDDVGEHEEWHNQGQCREADAEQLHSDHCHFDCFDVGQIGIAHDRVRNGKSRTFRESHSHVVDSREPEDQRIKKVRYSGHNARQPALPLRQFKHTRKVCVLISTEF